MAAIAEAGLFIAADVFFVAVAFLADAAGFADATGFFSFFALASFFVNEDLPHFKAKSSNNFTGSCMTHFCLENVRCLSV